MLVEFDSSNFAGMITKTKQLLNTENIIYLLGIFSKIEIDNINKGKLAELAKNYEID